MGPTSSQPKSFNSIPLSQALKLKRIFPEASDLIKDINELKESFISHGYKGNFLIDQFIRISEVTEDALLTSESKIANTPTIPLALKFNRTLLKLKKIIDKHCHLLEINPKLKDVFTERPIIAYKRNANLRNNRKQ